MGPSVDLAVGCFLGLALGDALGAPFEGGLLERGVWKLIGKTRRGEMRWTDDTQMSLDLAEVLISAGRVDPDALAAQFARSYRWSRGYGPSTARVLRRVAKGRAWRKAVHAAHPGGSFGNGAAMRAPVLGIFYASAPEGLRDEARVSASVTHAHPLGIEGAVLIAQATADILLRRPASHVVAVALEACASDAFSKKLERARSWLEAAATPSPGDVRRALGSGTTAPDSAVTALYLGLRFQHEPFQDLLDFVRQCGGDTDTIGAMSGALWGAANGAEALPDEYLSRLEARPYIEEVARSLWTTSRYRQEFRTSKAAGFSADEETDA